MSRMIWLAAVLLILLPACNADASERETPVMAGTDVSSRGRCVCEWRRPARVAYKRYRNVVGIHSRLRIGYDPLPYRFCYYSPPYRYFQRVAVVRVRSVRGRRF
jgi:hypothetical protein